MLSEPLNLLLVNKECQDLRPFRFHFHGCLGHRPLQGEGPKVYRQRSNVEVYRLFSFFLVFSRGERRYYVIRVNVLEMGVLEQWRVSIVKDYNSVTSNLKVVFLKSPCVCKQNIVVQKFIKDVKVPEEKRFPFLDRWMDGWIVCICVRVHISGRRDQLHLPWVSEGRQDGLGILLGTLWWSSRSQGVLCQTFEGNIPLKILTISFKFNILIVCFRPLY